MANTLRRPLTLATLAACLLSGLALPAFGAEVSPGDGAHSREAYRTCLDEEAALRAKRNALHKELQRHNAELKALQAEIDAHVAMQDQALEAGGEAIRSFNTKLTALNDRASAMNRLGDELERSQADFNARTKAARGQCGNLSVSGKDRAAVFNERAAEAASAPRPAQTLKLNQDLPR